ncbi:MAG TPA: chromosome segregation protein SMC, partial [Corynebacterium sp.]|nr:chromosome segregation protein SMC [Corynebacterium sp.]
MDIQELLSDSGIGREMHIIVGQNKLGEILESKPEDRRSFIEEAAGVLKHRRRKEKAQRKLQGMQANLDRLRDLTDELGRQLKPLARQAEAAGRAATVQADLRDARLRLAADRVVQLRATLDDTARNAEALAGQVAGLNEALAESTAVQTELEEQVELLNPQVEQAQQLWFRLSTLAERVSATSRIALERAAGAGESLAYSGPDPEELDYRAGVAEEEYTELLVVAEESAEQLEVLREEVAARQDAYEEAEAEHRAQVRAIADRREGVVRLLAQEEAVTGQVAAAEEEIARQEETRAERAERARSAEVQVELAQEQITDLQAGREPLSEVHTRAAEEARAAEERLEELREKQRQRERTVYSLSSRIDTLQESAPRPAAAGVLGEEWTPVAEHLQAEAGVEQAVSAALGTHAAALSGPLTVAQVELLGEVSRTVLVEALAVGESWRLEADLPAGTSWLLDHVQIETRVLGPLTRLLVDVVLVADVAQGQEVVLADPRLRAVTRGGTVVGPGWVETGSGSATAVEVGAEIAAGRIELAAAEAELAELSGTLAGAHQTAEEARVAAATATAALRERDAEVESWQRDRGRLVTQHEVDRKEYLRAAEQAAGAAQRLVQLRAELTEVRERLARVEEKDVPQEASSVERDQAFEALNQVKAMELEANLASRSAADRVAQAAGKGGSLRRQAEQAREARKRHEQAVQRRRRAAELAAAVDTHARDIAARVADALTRATVERDRLTSRKSQVAVLLSQAKAKVSATRQQVGRLTDTAHASEIAQSQAQVRIDEAEAKIVEQLGIAIPDLLAEYTPGEDFDRAEQEQRLKQAERDLRSLGKVNPLALEEYRALEERYEFLSTQLDDVLRARADLSEVIDEVDAQILTLFMEAWLDVEREFPKVFATLFPGGEGRLILTDPAEPLSTGIEVEARPPGKKVRRLSLLSGGEKSLTALAFLVAIFRARPSPFYVMDEVEAALDDVNLRRLLALFEEMRRDSQLIVITHQKPTMDIANVLYGVTMRDDGVSRVISQRMNQPGQATGAG